MSYIQLPKVSVLVTTYNRPEMLKKCVESILNQTYQDFEIIILDDNSSDRYQQEFLMSCWGNSKIIIFKSDVKNEDRKKTTRYATLINVGFKIARGEYISYCCDDDYFEPNKLEKTVQFLDSRAYASVVYGSQRCVQVLEGGQVIDKGTRVADQNRSDASCNVDHSSVVMRLSLVSKYGGWDDNPINWGAADAAYWKKLNDNGIIFYPINEILDTHVYHEGSWTAGGMWSKLGN